MTEDHRIRVLEHQRIAQLFSCSIEELFLLYQQEKDDPDVTFTCMIYSIGQWRFGRRAWSDHHIEYFKKRARENAAADITTFPSKKREKLSLADLGL